MINKAFINLSDKGRGIFMNVGRKIKSDVDYLEYINKRGHIRDLCIRVAMEKDIEQSIIIYKLPVLLSSLTEKQEKVARRYYLQQDTIYNIKHEFNFPSYSYVCKYLDSIVAKIAKNI